MLYYSSRLIADQVSKRNRRESLVDGCSKTHKYIIENKNY